MFNLALTITVKTGLLFFLASSSFVIEAQIKIEEHLNSFNKSYLYMGFSGNRDIAVDKNKIYYIGTENLPTSVNASLIFKRDENGLGLYKIYPSWTQNRFVNLVTNTNLRYYYAFQGTDIDVGCSAGGLKIMRLNKADLTVKDSTFFCHPVQDYAIFSSLFAYNKFYLISNYPYSPYGSISYNSLKVVDTNLVTIHFNRINDSTSKFGTLYMRKANDGGILLIGYENKNPAPSIIKLDTLGNKIWQKRYYTYAEYGCSVSNSDAFAGMQPYKNGYIVLANMSTSCTFGLRDMSFILKLDNNGNKLQEMQYTSCGDTMLDMASAATLPFTYRTQFKNVLIKTNDGNFASVISASNQYGYHTTKNYIVVLDSTLKIIHRSPPLGDLFDFEHYNLLQGKDDKFYFVGDVLNTTEQYCDVRIYTYKIGDTTVTVSDEPIFSVCSVYPNPSAQNVTIEYSSDTDNNKLKIYDMLGHLVLEQNLPQQNGKETVITENLSVGVYTYQLISQTKIVHQGKLVLTR